MRREGWLGGARGMRCRGALLVGKRLSEASCWQSCITAAEQKWSRGSSTRAPTSGAR
jgi:hypothetical protein